ncbi:MAG: LysM peptidoglycan-binding domain-containing protein [Rikenellaceae bacterium]
MKRFILTCLISLCTVVMAFAVTKSQVVVYINGQKYYIHTVESKETIYSIAKTYGVAEQTIIDLNSADIKAGENLKIPYTTTTDEGKELSKWQTMKTFSKHKIEAGETLYSISRLYEISIDTIIEDNPSIDPTALPIGEKLLIRKKMRGKSSEEEIEAEWSDYQSDLNLVAESDGYRYHIVEKGETIYSLSKIAGITQEEFIELNDLEGGLKAGSIIKMPLEAYATEGDQESEDSEEQIIEQIGFKTLKQRDQLKIALLLPLSSGEKVNRQFADFYKGFVAGIDSVKTKWGRDIELTLYNTERNIDTVEEIVNSDEFAGTNLIVGPIYEELLTPVIKYAERYHTPVVSPLASLKSTRSSVLFQLAPPTHSRYEKVKEMVDNTKHVTLIYTEQTDTTFEEHILSLLGDRPYDTHKYVYEHPTTVAEKMLNDKESAGDLSKFINNGKNNTIIVMSSNETDVDRVLSALSSAQINIVARGGKAPIYSVLGNSDWSKYNNIDRTVMFKNNVVLLSSYHAKRDNRKVRNFDSKYIMKHQAMPTLYVYRGFDTAMIFGEGLYSEIEYNLEGRTFTPLQSHYRFSTDPQSGLHTNDEWIRVNYKNDYTITIE